MNQWVKGFLTGLICIIYSAVNAQDIHFSQFYASPLLLNPANTGNYDGDWRIINNDRTQWRSITVTPYNTIAIGGDMQYYIHNEKFSAGLIFVNDKSGTLGLTTNQAIFTGAWHKIIKNNSFHIGIQAGVMMVSFDSKDLTFPYDYNSDAGLYSSGYGNQIYGTDAYNFGNRIYVPIVNAGIIWNRRFRNYMPEFGLAFNNINTPNESFDPQVKQPLNIRQNYHAACHFYLTQKVTITPRILYSRETTVLEELYGGNISYKIPANKFNLNSLMFGTYIRDTFSQQADAAIFIFGANIHKIDIGISYDINVSNLQLASNYRGAFEISLVYTEISTIFNKFTIPCDRY